MTFLCEFGIVYLTKGKQEPLTKWRKTMPEIILTVPTTPVEMTEEMYEIEAMYADLCELYSN